MNQLEFLTITGTVLKVREKLRMQGAIGFALASHWLKNWHESFKPTTKRRNCVITFCSNLKTTLFKINYAFFCLQPLLATCNLFFEHDTFNGLIWNRWIQKN